MSPDLLLRLFKDCERPVPKFVLLFFLGHECVLHERPRELIGEINPLRRRQLRTCQLFEAVAFRQPEQLAGTQLIEESSQRFASVRREVKAQTDHYA